MKLEQIIKSTGVSLSLVGVPIGMYFNQLYPTYKWSPIFMVLSILLLTNWRNLLRLRGKGDKWTIVIGFQIIMIAYGLLSPTDNMTTQLLSFHLYIIALCYAYISNKDDSFIDYIPKVVFYTSSIATILGVYFSAIGFVSGETAYIMRNEYEDFYIEAFTVSTGALINLFSAICMEKRNKIENIIVLIAIILDVYILFNSTKRTPIFIAIAGILVFWYKQGGIGIKGIKIIILKFIPLLILFLIAYKYLPAFHNMVDDIFTRLYTGIRILLGAEGSEFIEDSAQVRVDLKKIAYTYINNHFTFINYIFGAGYLLEWLDIPILESFVDMGIIGLFFYSYIVIFIPFRCYLKKHLSSVAIFSILVSLYPIFSAFNSGHPYMYQKYTGVCFVIFIFYQMRHKSIT